MNHDLDILLVNVSGTRKNVYQDLSKDFSALEPPFWAALSAGFLRNKGFGVEILDANVKHLTPEETAGAVEERNPKLTVIIVYGQQANVSTPIMFGARKACNAIKHLNEDRTVVMSGWHPSALPQRTLEEEACDFVVQGEGFYTLLALLEDRELSEIPGLWWSSNGRTVGNPMSENMEDLNVELSDVAWDLLPLRDPNYRSFNWMCLQDLSARSPYASMFTSLGCPYHCSFCAIHTTFGERRIRRWSPAWVLRQLDTLVREYEVKNIDFKDEIFLFDSEHYLPIVEGLIEREYTINMSAFARVDAVAAMDDDHLRTLKQAGLNWIKLGIESSNADIIKGIRKGHYDRELSKIAVEKCHNAGIDLCANFMFGLPGDTFDTMQETLNFALELNCAFPSFFCTMAPPGSELYDEAVAKGINLPDTWVGYSQQGYEFLPLPTEHLSATEVLWFRDYAFHTYFRNPRYLDMIKKKFGPATREHIEEMTAIKLKRKLLEDAGLSI